VIKVLKIKNQHNHLMELAKGMMIKAKVHLKGKVQVNKVTVLEKVRVKMTRMKMKI
jgi:hypothetical protein